MESTAIKYVQGDLIKQAREFDLIAHGCNCFCNMGAGIAKAVKEVFPEAYLEDLNTQYGDSDKLGTYTSYTYEDGFTVVNAYTQYKYTRHEVDADYEAIENVFDKLSYDFAGKKVGIPLIGAGLAGGDWDRIAKIIEDNAIGLDVTVVILPNNKSHKYLLENATN